MVRHVVVFSFVPEVDEGARAAMIAALEALVGVVPGLVSMTAGENLGLDEGNGDLAVVADFVDEDAWRGYQAHPAHLAVADEQIRPFVTGRSAVQFAWAG
jgi:hypothetical protein